MSESFAVELIGISKQYGSVLALDSVDLRVKAGTLHAIVGENGAGKTTLMRALYGAMQPDSGQIILGGSPVKFRNSADALQHGVGMVSQHYGIIGEMTCLENLVLGSERAAFRKPKAQAEEAQALADQMGFRFDWHAEASELSPAGAQKLEILKLLWRSSKIMILDEPTAMLSPTDAEQLFESLATLIGQGNTVLLVTHRLPEVLSHADHVTVLRGGKRVADSPVENTNAAELTQWIIGESTLQSHHRSAGSPGETLLRATGLQARDSRGFLALSKGDLDIRSGEIVGVAGVDGNGQRELFEAILGIVKIQSGEIQWKGSPMEATSTRERLSKGFRVIPEDRLEEAVIPEWSLLDNSVLGLQRIPNHESGSDRSSWANRIAARFRTKFGSLGQSIASLSGGNQQRFVAGRALESGPELLLAFQPARGLDLKGTADVYAAIREKCAEGMAALVIGFDLEELLENCDRMVVMHDGHVLAPPAGMEKDRAAIGRMMIGGTA